MKFEVVIKNMDTGEEITCPVEARTHEHAFSKVMRRSYIAKIILNDHDCQYHFDVTFTGR